MKNKKKTIGIMIISFIVTIAVGFTFVIAIKPKMEKNTSKEYKNSSYSVTYDNTWQLKEKKKDSLKLTHGKDGVINIEVIPLKEEYYYGSAKDMIDDMMHIIQEQNKDFKLLSKEEAYITKQNYDGYKLLYEDGDNQVYVAMGKKGDKAMLASYEATNESFDILLDSVQNIFYDFKILDESYKLSHELEVKSEQIKWARNEELKNLDKTRTFELAENNFWVELNVPVNFKRNGINSSMLNFMYDGLKDGSIYGTASIFGFNLYEYLDEDDKLSVFNETKIKKNDKDYSNVKDTLQKIKTDKGTAYIYKVEYSFKKNKKEDVYLIYELDKNHILEIELNASKTLISKELVDSFRIKSFKRYSSYIVNKVVDGKINSLMYSKDFSDIENVTEITLKVPAKYKELDQKDNIYDSRYYGLNYKDDIYIYDYEVNYNIWTSKDSIIKNLNSTYDTYDTYGKVNKLVAKGEKTYNGKKYDVYTASYKNSNKDILREDGPVIYNVQKTVLIYELKTGEALYIEIAGNNKTVDEDIIKELTDFNTKEVSRDSLK